MMLSQPIPDQAYSLGNPVAEFQGNPLRFIVALVMMLGLWAGAGFHAVNFVRQPYWESLCSASGFFTFGLLPLVFGIIFRRDFIHRIVVLDEGLLITKRNENIVLHWSEITAFLEHKAKHSELGIVYLVQYKYELTTTSHLTYHWDDQGIIGVHRLAGLIKQHIGTKQETAR